MTTHPEIEKTEKANADRPARPTPAERESRLDLVAQGLIEGKPREETLYEIERVWRVSRRTAQVYLHEAQARLASDAAEAEELFYLRLSQRQRDRLLQTVLNYTMALTAVDPKMVRMLTALVGSACRLMDGRNRTAGQIHKMLRGGRERGEGTLEMLRAGRAAGFSPAGDTAPPPGSPSETAGKAGADACAGCAEGVARDEADYRGINQQLDELDEHLKQALAKAENVAQKDPGALSDPCSEPSGAGRRVTSEDLAHLIREEDAPDIDDLFGTAQANNEELQTLRDEEADAPEDPSLEEAMLGALAHGVRRRPRRASRRRVEPSRPGADNEQMRRDLSCAPAQDWRSEDGGTPKTRPDKGLDQAAASKPVAT